MQLASREYQAALEAKEEVKKARSEGKFYYMDKDIDELNKIITRESFKVKYLTVS